MPRRIYCWHTFSPPKVSTHNSASIALFTDYLHFYRTELFLEESGVSVVPPPRSRSTTRMPPPPTQSSNPRQRQSKQGPSNAAEPKLVTTQEIESDTDTEGSSMSESDKDGNSG